MKRERQILENQLAIMEALKKLLRFEDGFEVSKLYGAIQDTRNMLAEPVMQPQEGDTPKYGKKLPLDAGGDEW